MLRRDLRNGHGAVHGQGPAPTMPPRSQKRPSPPPPPRHHPPLELVVRPEVQVTDVLRSVAWDGPAPAVGDVLTGHALGTLVVVHVAAGAGVGHWTLWCTRTRTIEWNPASWLA